MREENRVERRNAVPHVFAYLDPGSGSLMVQAGIATAVSVTLVARSKIAAGLVAVRRGVRRRQPDHKAPERIER
jgi:hypothetical protein